MKRKKKIINVLLVILIIKLTNILAELSYSTNFKR